MGGGTTTAARVSPCVWFGRLAGGGGGCGAGGAASRRHGEGGGVLRWWWSVVGVAGEAYGWLDLVPSSSISSSKLAANTITVHCPLPFHRAGSPSLHALACRQREG
jgi:hypothetical protein